MMERVGGYFHPWKSHVLTFRKGNEFFDFINPFRYYFVIRTKKYSAEGMIASKNPYCNV